MRSMVLDVNDKSYFLVVRVHSIARFRKFYRGDMQFRKL